jgi:hypothetical protein
MKIKTSIKKFTPIALIAILTISCESKPPVSNTSTSSQATPVATVDSNKNSRSGKFVSIAYPTSGQVTLSTDGDKNILELDENFKTAAGPDLRIVFHKAPDLSSVAAPPSYGIDEADYIVIEKLKNTSGKQRYEIPKDTKLKNFKSVAVWCAKMNKTYGFVSLP